jgi:Cu/Ag efflux protein CusF
MKHVFYFAIFVLWIIGSALRAGQYQVAGLVVSVDRVYQTVVVSHDAIPGYMPAMTMPYRVRESEILASVPVGNVKLNENMEVCRFSFHSFIWRSARFTS